MNPIYNSEKKSKWVQHYSSHDRQAIKNIFTMFMGKENEAVDVLSHDDHISDNKLNLLFFPP